jgi:hypothetical protein
MPSELVSHKVCTVCKRLLPLPDFCRSKRSADGRLYRCRTCDYKNNRKWRAAHPEEWAQHQQQYRQRAKGKLRADVRSRRAAHPDRYRAQWAVGNALVGGHLKRPRRCSVCHRVCLPDAHHEDYSKPLEILWVCRPCHYQLDKARREREKVA